ncbi:DUF2871 domain-containing protein [Staphylococcus simulans]|uniref:DUF2871 domain-containing protein n=1 Tax=Staphylococcus simulans TaxID=1286 RepID=UPI000D1F7B6C|nr:DUF2871 domain-containing protein [Staphylococcus simulans]MDY5061147.1 DUF2871 domain-containing protein [Staphylococcus simulans]PTJ19588.1 hypothetical protein BU038_03485 [Staphylococcus simulans]RIN76324.1 DUF2871 domain-containing protein [Staphylococcus simulans]
MRRILYTFLTYTIIGLLSGVYYRELTKAFEFTGKTQLAIVHTHILMLGMFMFLILLVFEKLFSISKYYLFNWFYYVYNIGLIVTVALQGIKGTMQVTGASISPGIAGIAGLGHMTLSAGFIILFFLLKKAILTHPIEGQTNQDKKL